MSTTRPSRRRANRFRTCSPPTCTATSPSWMVSSTPIPAAPWRPPAAPRRPPSGTSRDLAGGRSSTPMGTLPGTPRRRPGPERREPCQGSWRAPENLSGPCSSPRGRGTTMKITVHGGGGGEVTGSAYLIQTRDANVLVDCGLFQGARKVENYNRIPKSGAFKALDAVVLTHAHLDHTGRLPLLVKAGYAGPIHATPATIDFANLILSDSAHLQKADVERQNRKRVRMGQPLLESLYEQPHVDALRPLYTQLAYDTPTPL